MRCVRSRKKILPLVAAFRVESGADRAQILCTEHCLCGYFLSSLQAYSAREDLITQTKVSEQVRDFLLKKTERLKHQVCYLLFVILLTVACQTFQFIHGVWIC